MSERARASAAITERYGRSTRRQRWSTVATAAVIALLASGLPVSAAQAAPKPSGPPTPPAVATPAAATLPEVDMTCRPGQTDINQATAEELETAFALDAPVARRVMSFRPYLQVKDLLVVQGIGADKLRQIAATGRGCATPISTPPPAMNPCSSTAKVDLQSASADQVARTTGVNKNAAERVVAARPFATLEHVTPERVPGVGKGILDTVISRSCLTPQPLRDAATSWRWGYPSYDTTVTRDGYALKAPPGVIDAASGAWLSVTPLAIPESLPGPSYPRADFHISGAWVGPRTSGGPADEVFVTVPAATFASAFADAETFAPYLVHEGNGAPGENVYGDRVTVDAATGALTGRVTHLSVLDWAVRKTNYLVEPATGVLFGNRFTAPSCDRPWAQRPGTATYDSPAGAHADLLGALLDLPDNPVPLTGFLIKHCVQSGPGSNGWGDDVEVKLRNSTGTVQVLKPFSGDVSVAKIGDLSIDLVDWLVTSVDTGGQLYLEPGATGTATVAAGTAAAAQMQPDRARSLARVALAKILDYSLEKLGGDVTKDPNVRQVLQEMFSCAYGTWNAGQTAGGLDVARALSLAIYRCFDYEQFYFAVNASMQSLIDKGLLNSDQVKDILEGLLDVREAVKWLEWGKIAIDVSDSLIWGSLPDVPINIEHYAAKPTRDDLGRIIKPACISAYMYAWRIDMNCQNAAYAQQQTPTGGGGDSGLPLAKMIRDTEGHAWLVTSDDQKMHPITSGGTYICLSKHYAIDWGLDYEDLRAYRDASGPNRIDATCDGSVAPTRKIENSPAGNPDLSAVLRIDDGPESWIVLGGYRYHIPTGEEFNCWVNPQYRSNIEFDVYDFVDRAELESWPVGDGSISNCGDPENPEF